jgi:hypothetical protein
MRMEVTEETAREHVEAAEARLRDELAILLKKNHGADWETTQLGDEHKALAGFRAKELRDRPEAPPEPDLLGYAGFPHIREIAKRHWDCCVKTGLRWPSAAVMEYELETLHVVRNPAAHGRPLYAHEYVHAEGTARRLRRESEERWRERNKVTGEYWPYIESAEDDRGHRATGPGAVVIVQGGIVTEGELIELRVRAFDPNGRELKYRLQNPASVPGPWTTSSTMEWRAGPTGRQREPLVYVRAGAGPYAQDDYDARVHFVYEVRPADAERRTRS